MLTPREEMTFTFLHCTNVKLATARKCTQNDNRIKNRNTPEQFVGKKTLLDIKY